MQFSAFFGMWDQATNICWLLRRNVRLVVILNTRLLQSYANADIRIFRGNTRKLFCFCCKCPNAEVDCTALVLGFLRYASGKTKSYFTFTSPDIEKRIFRTFDN